MVLSGGARALVVFLLSTFVGASGMGQTDTNDTREVRIRYETYKPPAASISVESNLVELGVTVRDGNGQPISGMSASDFEVLDDGKPQQIAFFSEQRAGVAASSAASAGSGEAPSDGATHAASVVPEAKRPRYITLFIDDAHSELPVLRASQLAAENFVATDLEPNNQVAIFTTSGAVTVDFTADTNSLRAALERLRPHVERGEEAMTECPTLTSYQGYVIANNLDLKAKGSAVKEAVACHCAGHADSTCTLGQERLVEDLADTVWNQTKYHSTDALEILKIALRQLANAPGDRILVLVSPGFVTGGMQQQASGIIDIALRSHIVINSLDAEGLVVAGESPEGDRVDEGMRQLIVTELMSTTAAATGGRFVQDNNDLMSSLRTLATAPEDSYLLGFAPPANPDAKYHHLKIRLTSGEEYKIQARAGYYSVTPVSESAQKVIDHEVASQEELHAIPIVVQASPARTKNGQLTIDVVTTVDAKHLKFAKQNGRAIQELTFVTVLRDSRGDYVTGVEAVMDLSLTPKTLARMRTNGIKEVLSLNAPGGSYEVREVVREVVENHLAASNTAVEWK
jgi:VWFA-related protein